MKLQAWYSRDIFPLDVLEKDGLFSLSLRDANGETSGRVLLTGISGIGKSSLLQGIAAAWAGLALLLRGEIPHLAGSRALVLEGVLPSPLLLCYAREESFWHSVAQRHPKAVQLGVLADARGGAQADWQALSQVMRGPDFPNILWMGEEAGLPAELEGEDRFALTLQQILSWVRERGGFAGAMEDLAKRHPQALTQLRDQLNLLFSGKRLKEDDEHYRVWTRRGGSHALEALSSGERRILLLLFAAALTLHPGGILLVDEPESHIHPSQIIGLLSTLEQWAARGDGQLILSSHTPQVWRRYENLGLLVTLEEDA